MRLPLIPTMIVLAAVSGCTNGGGSNPQAQAASDASALAAPASSGTSVSDQTRLARVTASSLSEDAVGDTWQLVFHDGSLQLQDGQSGEAVEMPVLEDEGGIVASRTWEEDGSTWEERYDLQVDESGAVVGFTLRIYRDGVEIGSLDADSVANDPVATLPTGVWTLDDGSTVSISADGTAIWDRDGDQATVEDQITVALMPMGEGVWQGQVTGETGTGDEVVSYALTIDISGSDLSVGISTWAGGRNDIEDPADPGSWEDEDPVPTVVYADESDRLDLHWKGVPTEASYSLTGTRTITTTHTVTGSEPEVSAQVVDTTRSETFAPEVVSGVKAIRMTVASTETPRNGDPAHQSRDILWLARGADGAIYTIAYSGWNDLNNDGQESEDELTSWTDPLHGVLYETAEQPAEGAPAMADTPTTFHAGVSFDGYDDVFRVDTLIEDQSSESLPDGGQLAMSTSTTSASYWKAGVGNLGKTEQGHDESSFGGETMTTDIVVNEARP